MSAGLAEKRLEVSELEIGLKRPRGVSRRFVSRAIFHQISDFRVATEPVDPPEFKMSAEKSVSSKIAEL